MADLFISHAREDNALATRLAEALDRAGYSTWIYSRDSVPGLSYLVQTGQAIRDARCVIILISPASLQSHQVTREVIRTHEENKPVMPLLLGLTHDEFARRQSEWREALGSATSLVVPPEGLEPIFPRILAGLSAMGVAGKETLARATGKARILLAEDEQMVRTMLELVLTRKADYQVAMAVDAASAMAMARQFKPDLLLTDIRMPGQSGLELIDQLRRLPEFTQLPVVIMSAYSYAMAQGATDSTTIYMAKPFEIDMLILEIGRLLDAAKNRDGGVPPPLPTPVPRPSSPVRATQSAVEEAESLDAYQIEFTDACAANLRTLALTPDQVRELVSAEFRSHTNYFRFDLEDYPLPLRSSYIVYINKIGLRIQFTRLVSCTADQAKLASWSDLLSLYRRATRFAYRRGKPEALLVDAGAVARVVTLHVDLRTRIRKHYETFERLPLEPLMYGLPAMPTPDPAGAPARPNSADVAAQIAFHLIQSARADESASRVEQDARFGDITLADATGLVVTDLERSLQHLHKILLAFPPLD